MKRESVEQIIFDALTIVNHAREDEEKIPISVDTLLFGGDGCLDSMGLVAFLIDIEESLQDEGYNVVLSDERAMSQKNSPFRSVPSLVDYIIMILAESTDDSA